MAGNTYMFSIKVEGANATATINNVTQAASGANSMFGTLNGSIRKIGESAFVFNQIKEGLTKVSQELNSTIEPGVALNSSMADLSAVTGETGKSLQLIESYARKTAKTFGGSAAQGVESYKLILSQLSPEIAKVPEALAAMGENIAITSKMMGGDTTAAAEVLTTAMNQYQVSLADPMKASRKMAEMMNIMAAGAKEGSAELPAIKAALEQSGMAAKAAGVSFAETIASIEVLDKAGKKGSEGGVALRNVMATLSQGRFLPKDVQEELTAAGVNINSLTDKTLSLAERLKPLQAIMADDALITKMFGKENSNAAIAILSGLDTVEKYTAAITGTNTAVDQANIIMDSYAERMSRQRAFVDDLKITLFNFCGAIMPYVNGTITFFQGTASVMMGINAMAAFSENAWMKAIKARTKALFKGTSATVSSIGSLGAYNALTLASVATTYGFSFALKAVSKAIYAIPIIGWVAAGITLLITAFKILWEKCEGFRRILFAAWEVVKAVFYNIGVVIKSLWDNILKPYFMFWWNLVKAVANGIWSALKWCWNGIVSGFQAVGDFFVGLWDGVMSGVSAVGDFFTGIWDWLAESCGGVTTWISDAFSKIAEPIKTVFSGVWDFFKMIFGKIKEVLNKFFGWIGKIWNKLFPKEKFKDLGEAAEEGLKKGSESWQKSQDQKKKAGDQPLTVPGGEDEDKEGNMVSKTFTANQKTKKTKAKADQKEVVDLNNVKGSTDYGAIMAKLTPTAITGLSTPATPAQAPAIKQTSPAGKTTDQFNPATQEYKEQKTDYLKEICLNVQRIAASVALFAGISTITPAAAMTTAPANTPPSAKVTTTTPAITMPPPVVSITPVTMVPPAPAEPVSTGPDYALLSGRSQEKPNTSTSLESVSAGKTRNTFGKFCDQVVINVPAGTSKDMAEQIIREVMNRINNEFNGD